MKANQAFVNNEEAVSPVIGVILMVAITVVLAAVVFVLVSDLGGDTENTPTMSFDKDETDNTLTVISSGDAVWADITGTATPDAGTCTVTLPTGDVDAGDIVDVTMGGLATTCAVSLTYEPSNALLGSWDFAV